MRQDTPRWTTVIPRRFAISTNYHRKPKVCNLTSVSSFSIWLTERKEMNSDARENNSSGSETSIKNTAADKISFELIEEVIGNADVEFDTRSVKIRCVNCQRELDVVVSRVPKALKLFHTDAILTLTKQKHFFLRWLNREVTITIWRRDTPRQPKFFFR